MVISLFGWSLCLIQCSLRGKSYGWSWRFKRKNPIWSNVVLNDISTRTTYRLWTSVNLCLIDSEIWPCFAKCEKGRLLRNCFNYQLNAQFLYSITIYMLHYNPVHVSSITMLIFRRSNCIITASGIVTLCTVQYAGWEQTALQSAVIRHTVHTEGDDTRCCDNTICPPEDGHVDARNM